MTKSTLRVTLPLGLLFAVGARAGQPDTVCRAQVDAGPCTWVTGRLFTDNWRPAVRLLTVGTPLGYFAVYSSEAQRAADARDNQHPRLPQTAVQYRLLAGIRGNFEVCPLPKHQTDRIPAVCVTEAKDLSGEESSEPPHPAREFPVLDPDAAERAIRDAPGFWGVVIGIQGSPTPAVAGYRSLLKAPDGAVRFRRLLKTGEVPAQLYALCGLYLLDRESFAVELKRLWQRSDGKSVEVGLYDGSTESSVRDVLGSERPRPMAAEGDGDFLDIASGARCRMLAERPLPY